MQTIETLNGKTRMSTQALLQTIARAVAQGETEFTILASGQHDIGGPLWNREGKTLTFHVKDPGQRAGAMALKNTHVIVHGPAPADVGWLNSGGTITVLGDCGDTAGHSQAEGKIYIGGRAGTRTGSLMKKDPLAGEPELWILKSTGSFSFEFMGGGKAVVCGVGVEDGVSVLGERPCVGMVGGTIYVRGTVPPLPQDVTLHPLDEHDRACLAQGLPVFLEQIQAKEHLLPLLLWENWHKIVPVHAEEETDRDADASSAHEQTAKNSQKRDMRTFRTESWIPNGIFSDIFPDPGVHNGLTATGIYRLRIPLWKNREHLPEDEKNRECQASAKEYRQADRRDNVRQQEPCRDCHLCEMQCPEQAISRCTDDAGLFCYVSHETSCIGCGICAAICPCGIWTMQENEKIWPHDA